MANNPFWRWGDDNLFPAALSAMSRRSTTHRRIINDKADYIAGRGFNSTSELPLLKSFTDRANGNNESLRTVLYRVAFDKVLFGNAFLEVVTDSAHSTIALYHQDASRCRIARDSKHVLLHHDWAHFKPEEARTLPLYPAYKEQRDGTRRSIIHYKDYEPGFEHYGIPDYVAGMNVSAIVYKTDCWNISRLDRSFRPSGVMMIDSSACSLAETERLQRRLKEEFAGEPGRVMFMLRDGEEMDNSRFIPIEAKSEGDWRSLHDQASADIVVAHSWFRALGGLDYSSGFSAERILHEYEIALSTVIHPRQEELLEPIRKVISDALQLDASSLEIINRPPTRTRPPYMRVWEARRDDGLDFDPDDLSQQQFLAQIISKTV